MNFKTKSVVAALACVGAVAAAQAGVIVGATGVTTTIGSLNATYYPAENLINQSGLTTGYTSGTTDFDSYVGSATVDAIQGSYNYIGAINAKSGDLVFDLGAVKTLGALALWNGHAYQSNAIKDFELYDADSNTLLGSYTAIKGPVVSGNDILAQVFDFQAVTTQHIRMHVLNNWGGSLIVASEVAFEQVPAPAAVPEPGSLALAGLGLAGMVATRRRRKSA